MNQKQLIRKKKLESYVRQHNESVRLESFKVTCTICGRKFLPGDDIEVDNQKMANHNTKYHNGRAVSSQQFVGI